MSRLVRGDVGLQGRLLGLGLGPVRAPIAAVAPAVAGAANQTDTDNYATRMVKYIPAEVIAFYLAADKLFAKAPELASATRADEFVAKNLYYFSVAVFVIGLLFTPLYLWRSKTAANEPWGVHAVVSMIAFAIWAYAVRGEICVPIYSSAIAAFLVLVFTFASGLVKPGSTVQAQQ